MVRKWELRDELYNGADLFGYSVLAKTVDTTTHLTATVAALVLQSTDEEIAARHSAPLNDPAVKYVVWLEKFYAKGNTDADKAEFAKSRAITITPEVIKIGDISLKRARIGVLDLAWAKPHLFDTPTRAQWEKIFQAIPGGSEWPKAMKALLDIDLDKNLWEHDIHGRGGMVSMETHNIGSRMITCDHNARWKASLFVLIK